MDHDNKEEISQFGPQIKDKYMKKWCTQAEIKNDAIDKWKHYSGNEEPVVWNKCPDRVYGSNLQDLSFLTNKLEYLHSLLLNNQMKAWNTPDRSCLDPIWINDNPETSEMKEEGISEYDLSSKFETLQVQGPFSSMNPERNTSENSNEINNAGGNLDPIWINNEPRNCKFDEMSNSEDIYCVDSDDDFIFSSCSDSCGIPTWSCSRAQVFCRAEESPLCKCGYKSMLYRDGRDLPETTEGAKYNGEWICKKCVHFENIS